MKTAMLIFGGMVLAGFLATRELAASESPASIVIVVGAGGLPEYDTQFQLWASRWKELGKTLGADLTVIGLEHSSKKNDRQRLQASLEQQLSPSSTPLILVMLGHGTHGQDVAKFNLKGPDVSADELTTWIGDSPRRVAVIQCSSASAAFLTQLSAANRIIITATRSRAEQNFSRFGDFFSSSLTDATADLDHDHAISLLESFLFASDRVARFYEKESRLATEHSLLDDNGDGRGTASTFFRGIRAAKAARDGSDLDGLQAHQIILYRFEEHTPLPPDSLAKRDDLEQRLESLRQKKGELDGEQYYLELESLMVQISQLYAENDDTH
ncbi:MAG: hypothetical protein GY768_15100 [Planctomycetaceae bacterium]|nr:hypothetical protein [Planctomycetaceae bacterium]